MIPQRYAYLTTDILFLIIWLILFIRRKDLRKEILIMSVFISISGLIGEYLWWTKDWWRPQTITNTTIGIEDLLLGFTNGGIAAVLYEEVFRKRLYKRRKSTNDLQFLLLGAFTFFAISLSFYFLKYTSFISTTIGLSFVSIILILLRKDLFISALVNGLLMALLTLPCYYFLILISPGFIGKTWLFDHLSNLTITGVPIEDIVFYFLVGFVTAPLYEYWQSVGLTKIKK